MFEAIPESIRRHLSRLPVAEASVKGVCATGADLEPAEGSWRRLRRG